MPHQKYALAWLLWREEHHPCGGFLADEAGLVNILTMISLVLLMKQEAKATRKAQKGTENMFIPSSCTVVICPASRIELWAEEVERCCKPGQLNIYLYRGQNRERRPEKLAKYDMVFMSYRMVWTDLKSLLNNVNGVEAAMENQPALLRVCWDRIILDKAQNIKNHKTQTAILICQLRARARWVVTAYPIQNNTLEMFSFFRFLRFTPYDKLPEWKRQVTNTEELHTLVKGILWRTKDQETSSGNPIKIHKISLSSEERKIYDQLVHQYRSTPKTLIILQQLMQCCGHLSLVKELTDVTQLDPIFYEPSFFGTKIKFVIDRLKEIRSDPADGPMKTIIVSQWTEMLDVVASHLKKAGFKYWNIRRAISLKKRSEAMDDFNINPRGREVMLVSLKAGRDGLNLIGGNHLFFLDMHCNPFLEDIVCDSVCGEGQMRDVHIHKFVCVDTIEERILELQEEKRQLAKDVLTGSKSKKEKLSLADLKFVFGNPYEHEA